MPFQFTRTIRNFSVETVESAPVQDRLTILFDIIPTAEEKKLLENLLKLRGKLLLVTPENQSSMENLDWATFKEIISLADEKTDFVVAGNFAPFLVRQFNQLNGVGKVVFINPGFSKDIATLMSSFDTQCLVLTATPGNLDHDPDAVKYHDLISGSSIQYVRGVSGNPLFKKFTQSFNAIQRFLLDE